jgi:hypothetical protein
MRYLKIYEEFDEIPNNFVRLDSIGHVLDPNEGVIYALLKRGGYDIENPYDVDEHDHLNLEPHDMEVLDKYWLSVEPLVKDKINFDLIETTKELALDYLDEGDRLIIYAFISDILVYTEIFSHDVESVKYPKYFKNRLDIISSSDDIKYIIRLDDKKYYFESEKSKELSSLVKEYFPTEKVDSH